MANERISKLFATLDPTIRSIVEETLSLEQQHISMERPRLKDQLDEIITKATKRKIAMEETGSQEVASE